MRILSTLEVKIKWFCIFFHDGNAKTSQIKQNIVFKDGKFNSLV